MKNIKYILLFVCIAGCLASCKKDSVEDFDVEAQYKADTTAIRKYVVANNITVLKDSYGIFYEIQSPGQGTATITSSSKVTVDYTGKVMGASSYFDNSAGTPRELTLGNLIAGWQIGIPHIQKGGKIRLFIPSYYGYGNTVRSAIPANSVLDFTITLTDVK